jgi:UDP-N-acetylmuramoyl-L-alanyl-D-glutamate--2,6-diaminopimelate ligase
MELRTLLDGIADSPPPALGCRVCDLTEDSRTVVPGSLFVARRGTKTDGSRYVDQALRAGACAVLTDDPALRARVPIIVVPDARLTAAQLAERFYAHPSRSLDIVGVTGTNGKTTVATLVWQLLNARSRRCGLIGTVSIDDGTEIARADMTTPPAMELSRLLARMRDAGYTAAAMEISSHALDQRRADALRLRVGVFTNLTGDHLDYHKSMDAYAHAKARLFALLPDDALAVINADDPAAAAMIARCRCPILRCSARDPKADARLRMLDESLAGMHLELSGPFGSFAARVPMIGRYNAMNILQACIAAHALGLTPAELAQALPTLTPPQGRLERLTSPENPVQVFVDYAHTDDALARMLGAVRGVMPVGEGRLIAVFGCGGDRDTTKRPRMGAAATEIADLAVITSDNPRTERPQDIITQILAGVPANRKQKTIVHADREHAIREAIALATAGDVIVIAGKGHENEQILPDHAGGVRTVPFDDREVARRLLEDAGHKTLLPHRPKRRRA